MSLAVVALLGSVAACADTTRPDVTQATPAPIESRTEPSTASSEVPKASLDLPVGETHVYSDGTTSVTLEEYREHVAELEKMFPGDSIGGAKFKVCNLSAAPLPVDNFFFRLTAGGSDQGMYQLFYNSGGPQPHMNNDFIVGPRSCVRGWAFTSTPRGISVTEIQYLDTMEYATWKVA